VFNPFDGPSQDVTDLVAAYEVGFGVTANIDSWPVGARTNADGSLASTATPPVARTALYSPENLVETDEAGGAYAAAAGATANPSYPCVLERQDGREGREVDFTVVDLQRLQYWYRDYLDFRDGGGLDGSIDLSNRSLLIYVSRSRSGGGFVAGAGRGALQAVKLIGSEAGRTRTAVDRQVSPTLLVRTTLATDNPIYLEGDFNAPGHAGGSTSPGGVGCALISDAVTLLSNDWGPRFLPPTLDAVAPPYTGGTTLSRPTVTVRTTYNAAFFTGRHDFRGAPAGGEEAGIHNFVRFLETWGGRESAISGCLINLWFSRQAVGPHGLGYYSPPTRSFGWDRQFGNPSYWPPYVPSIYSMERTAWREE
jgi:hypothetical protein